MEYFNFYKWRVAVNALNHGYDTYGCYRCTAKLQDVFGKFLVGGIFGTSKRCRRSTPMSSVATGSIRKRGSMNVLKGFLRLRHRGGFVFRQHSAIGICRRKASLSDVVKFVFTYNYRKMLKHLFGYNYKKRCQRKFQKDK